MNKPTIFLIDSDLIDINILVLKIERKFNCKIYTFFDIEEVLIYNDICPNILIVDEDTYTKKADTINKIITNLNPAENANGTRFVVYSATGIVDIHKHKASSLDKIDIVPLDMGYNSIQTSLNRIIE